MWGKNSDPEQFFKSKQPFSKERFSNPQQGHDPWEALQSYSGLPPWSLGEDCLSTGWLFMIFFLKVPQILVAAIWMCSQIGSSCRMSEYSTGPTAVRKEQGVVKVLCFQTHPGFLFLPGSCEMRNRTSAFPSAFHLFWGHWCPPWKESSRPVPEKWPLLFLHRPVVSLNISQFLL